MSEASKAAFFRKYAEETRPVVLPVSKACVVVRRPTRFYWVLRRTLWPRDLIDKLDAQIQGVEPKLTGDEIRLLTSEQTRMVHEAFVEPKVCLDEIEGQFDTDWLDAGDGAFLVSYLRGVVDENGRPCKEASQAAPSQTPAGQALASQAPASHSAADPTDALVTPISHGWKN